MTDTEKLLREHGAVKQRIRAIECDIAALEAKKQDIYEALYIKPPDKINVSGGRVFDAEGMVFNPVAEAVIRAVDVYTGAIKELTKDLNAAMAKLTFIECLPRTSGLDETELRYVQLRYFRRLSIISICERLYCSPATVTRIRAAALNKINSPVSER